MLYNKGIVWITIAVAFIMQLIQFPSGIWMLKPNYLLLVLIYWILVMPCKFQLFYAFFMGLIYDMFSGSLLGLHSFIFVALAYLVILRAQAIRNYALWHQIIIIMVLSLLYDLFLYLFQAVLFSMVNLSPSIFLSCLSDAAIWIFITLSLQGNQKIDPH